MIKTKALAVLVSILYANIVFAATPQAPKTFKVGCGGYSTEWPRIFKSA